MNKRIEYWISACGRELNATFPLIGQPNMPWPCHHQLLPSSVQQNNSPPLLHLYCFLTCLFPLYLISFSSNNQANGLKQTVPGQSITRLLCRHKFSYCCQEYIMSYILIYITSASTTPYLHLWHISCFILLTNYQKRRHKTALITRQCSANCFCTIVKCIILSVSL